MAEDKSTLSGFNIGTVKEAEFGQEMQEDFLAYSMSVIVARALPDVRDGLKPVHRRILYAMNESGIVPTRPHKKSAWTVGEVIGKYHPHGDVAVYETMVRLAQDFSMRIPLVDGHGNFGSIDGDSAAAMRYTESRLTKSAMEVLRDLDKDTVDWQPNYDESLQEPKVLPSRFPNLLVNGSSGIAVGMATNIAPHNLGETIDATIAQINNPDISTEELMVHLPGPDFPTGAIIMGTDGIKEAYETGRGTIVVRAKVHVEQTKGNKSRLIVTEIPYQVNKSNLLQKIAQLAKDKKIPEVTGLRDESDRKGMRVVIELKQGVEPQVVLNQLYKHTQLQNNFGVIDLALVDGVPKVLTLKEILHHYITHQQEIVTRRTRFDLKKAEERAHILRGLMIALDNIDEVIQIIRSSSDDKEAAERLATRFGLTEPQTTAILEMRLRRLTGLERGKVEAELAELETRIAYYNELLADPKKIDGVIIDELTEIKEKHSNKRRSEIAHAVHDLDVEDLIADEDMVVTMTIAGYVKRLPVATYRQQKRGGKGKQGVNLKDNDFVEKLFIASTHDYVLFFSTRGKVYRLKVHEIPVGSRQARGTAVVNLLQLEDGERIAAVITTREFADDRFLMFATKRGETKKTAMSEYNTSRKGGLIAISLKSDDELIAVRQVSEGDSVMLVTTDGKAIKWDESEVRPMGRNTMGVKGIKLKPDADLLGMEISHNNMGDLLVITEKGYGKRTKVEEYPLQHRGGQGVNTIQMTEKKGLIAGMKILGPQHELMIVSEEGIVLRVKTSDVPQLGRATQGVKIMNVADEDRVTAIARMVAPKHKAPQPSDENQGVLDLESDADETEHVDLGDSNDKALAEELIAEDFEEE